MKRLNFSIISLCLKHHHQVLTPSGTVTVCIRMSFRLAQPRFYCCVHWCLFSELSETLRFICKTVHLKTLGRTKNQARAFWEDFLSSFSSRRAGLCTYGALCIFKLVRYSFPLWCAVEISASLPLVLYKLTSVMRTQIPNLLCRGPQMHLRPCHCCRKHMFCFRHDPSRPAVGSLLQCAWLENARKESSYSCKLRRLSISGKDGLHIDEGLWVQHQGLLQGSDWTLRQTKGTFLRASEGKWHISLCVVPNESLYYFILFVLLV